MFFETKKVSLAEQSVLILQTVLSKELVKVFVITGERLTFSKFLRRGKDEIALGE